MSITDSHVALLLGMTGDFGYYGLPRLLRSLAMTDLRIATGYALAMTIRDGGPLLIGGLSEKEVLLWRHL